MNKADVDISPVLHRVTYLGLSLNVVIPITVFILALFIHGKSVHTSGPFDMRGMDGVEILFYAMLAVVAIGFGAQFLIRKNLPPSMLRLDNIPLDEQFERSAVSIATVVYSVNLSYTVYGVVLSILGLSLEVLMLFVALTFIGFQVFRPRKDYLNHILDYLEQRRAHMPG